MDFSTNVMFRTLHSNFTIYLSVSTLLPSGDVRVHSIGLHALTVGVGRLTGKWNVEVHIISTLVRRIYTVSLLLVVLQSNGMHEYGCNLMALV